MAKKKLDELELALKKMAAVIGGTFVSKDAYQLRVVSVTGDLNNQQCPVTLSEAGQQCSVIYENCGTADYTVSVATTYKSPDGGGLTLTVPTGGYAEVNFIKYGSTVYVRGV